MALEDWTVPDPSYFPVTPIGLNAGIDQRKFDWNIPWEIKEVVEDPQEPGKYFYKAETSGISKTVLKEFAAKRYVFDSVVLDKYANVWVPEQEFPAMRVGDTFQVEVEVSIEGVYRDSNYDDAFVNIVRIHFKDHFIDILREKNLNIKSSKVTVLAKGIDSYLG